MARSSLGAGGLCHLPSGHTSGPAGFASAVKAEAGGGDVKRTSLIRLAGLAAMVGGCVYAVQGLLVPLLVGFLVPKDAVQMTPPLKDEGIPPEKVIPGGRIMEDINTVFFVLLVLSVMALIASVHAL